MLLLFFGPSCSGKSTIAEIIKEKLGTQVFSGKDYLRFAKQEAAAWKEFESILTKAAKHKSLSQDSAIYVVTNFNEIKGKLCDIDNMVRIKFTADIEILKKRFSKRLNGKMPPLIENMLKGQLNNAKSQDCHMEFDTSNSESISIADKIIQQHKN